MTKPKHEQMDFKGLELLADEFTGTFNGTVGGALASITVLTDNSGGATANNTIEAVPAATDFVTDTTAASLTSTNTSLTAIKNDTADLTAKVNAIINALN